MTAPCKFSFPSISADFQWAESRATESGYAPYIILSVPGGL